MDFHYILAHVLTVVFALGLAGCALVIPMAAWKFFSVLLEEDTPEQKQGQYVQMD